MRSRLRWACGATPPGLVGVLLLIAVAMAVSTRQYARVWQSDLALWAYAVERAPHKPRTVNNYGVALAARGRLREARAWFVRATVAGVSPRLPRWDRREGYQTGLANVQAIDALIAQLQQATRR